ncbi:MAG: AraC family transcriptional regulator [Victivallaceae bacterium]|jgi:AraC-like DNA-binding protein
MLKHNSGTVFEIENQLPELPALRLIYVSTIYDAAYYWTGGKRLDENACAFQYTLSGLGRFCDGQTTFDLPPGAGFLFSHGDPSYSYYYPEDATEPWRVLWCSFVSDTTAGMVSSINRQWGYVFELKQSSEIISRMQAYCKSGLLSSAISSAESCSLVMELLSALVWSKEKKCGIESGNLISDQARGIIKENTHRLLTVEQLAKMLDVSREHLGRKFRQETGISPYQYILNNKIEHAKLQLMSSATPVKLLADQLGFSSAAQFNNVFKKITGIPPNAYRRMHFRRK